jgi:hypothetical protein
MTTLTLAHRKIKFLFWIYTTVETRFVDEGTDNFSTE